VDRNPTGGRPGAINLNTFVTHLTEEFVASDSDFSRSATTGAVIVGLLILILVERELLASAGRRDTRGLTAFAVPLFLILTTLILVRLNVLLD
jgi:membrane protease YdiL (CAAX protease family)